MTKGKIYLNRWPNYLGDIRLANITSAQILSYRTKQLETVSPHSVTPQTL
jgi:hypothetical protein